MENNMNGEYKKSVKNANSSYDDEEPCSLGWLKLYIIAEKNTSTSQTVYIKRNNRIYAVLHTDTCGATKCISLPAKEDSGSDYCYVTEKGDEKINRE